MMNGHPLVSIYPLSRPFPMTCLCSHWLSLLPPAYCSCPMAHTCSRRLNPFPNGLKACSRLPVPPTCPLLADWLSWCRPPGLFRWPGPQSPLPCFLGPLCFHMFAVVVVSAPWSFVVSLSSSAPLCCSISFPCFPGFPSMLLWAFLIGPSAPWRGTTSYTLIAC